MLRSKIIPLMPQNGKKNDPDILVSLLRNGMFCTGSQQVLIWWSQTPRPPDSLQAFYSS